MHACGKSLTATPVCPEVYEGRCTDGGCTRQCWWLLDGSPASCAQIGLFNMGWPAKEFDLVISGPSHGPNASTIFNLSRGTVGGAFEATLCGKKAISLSFGSKDPQPPIIIHDACKRAVGLVEQLHQR